VSGSDSVSAGARRAAGRLAPRHQDISAASTHAVIAIASEHDQAAGTERGPNTVFVFGLDGLRIAHFGDFGQRALRDEQEDAIGEVDVLFVPAGGEPTIGGEVAAGVVRAIGPRLVVPMHHRTPKVNFLDPPDEFLAALGLPVTEAASEVDADGLEGVVLLAPPG